MYAIAGIFGHVAILWNQWICRHGKRTTEYFTFRHESGSPYIVAGTRCDHCGKSVPPDAPDLVSRECSRLLMEATYPSGR